jgi:hypothetical protein
MGVEMLIDAHLIADPELLSGYLRALAVGASSAHVHRGQDPEAVPSLMGLCGHLLDRGAWVHAIAPERLERRLGGALAHRPRLPPTSKELELIAKYLCDFELTREQMPHLLDQLAPLLSGRKGGDLPSPDVVFKKDQGESP